MSAVSQRFKLNDFNIRVFVFIILLIIFAIANPTVASLTNLIGLLNNSVYLGIAGIGLMSVMITGSFDMSSASVALISFYGTAYFYRLIGYEGDYISGFFLAGIIGVICSMISMAISLKFNLSGFVVSLAWSMILGAFLFIWVNGYISQADMPQGIISLSSDYLFSIKMADGTRASLNVSFVALVALALVVWIILNKTLIGRGVYALGGDAQALERVGFNKVAVNMVAYSMFGFCSGVAGIIYYANITVAEPAHVLATAMDIIAAAIFGGCNLKYGKGSVGGILAGVMIITLINNNLVLIGVSPFAKTIVIGGVLMVSIFLSSLKEIREREI